MTLHLLQVEAKDVVTRTGGNTAVGCRVPLTAGMHLLGPVQQPVLLLGVSLVPLLVPLIVC